MLPGLSWDGPCPLPELQSAGILGPGQLSALWSLHSWGGDRLLTQQVRTTVTCFWFPCTPIPAVLESRFLHQPKGQPARHVPVLVTSSWPGKEVNCLDCDLSGTQAGVC